MLCLNHYNSCFLSMVQVYCTRKICRFVFAWDSIEVISYWLGNNFMMLPCWELTSLLGWELELIVTD